MIAFSASAVLTIFLLIGKPVYKLVAESKGSIDPWIQGLIAPTVTVNPWIQGSMESLDSATNLYIGLPINKQMVSTDPQCGRLRTTWVNLL